MKAEKLIFFVILTIFMYSQAACSSRGSPDIEEADDDNGDDDDDDNDDIFDDDSQFNDDDVDDDEDETDTYMDGCEGVDFLFVIDNSLSMEDEQNNLINSFPGFMDAITEVIEIDSYHVMAIDSDARYGPGKQGQQNCDNTLGAGHVGQNLDADCNIQGGNRYLIQDQPDLAGTFGCIAHVGFEGNGYERLMEAQGNAVGALNGQGQCNAGFIRPKAILVATFITDEDEECTEPQEECSSGNPQSWHDALVLAKGGNARAIVVLGVFGDNDLPDGICTEYDDQGNGAMAAPLLRQYLELWDEDRRHYCSVCLEDYSECFLEAVDIIDNTCDDIVE